MHLRPQGLGWRVHSVRKEIIAGFGSLAHHLLPYIQGLVDLWPVQSPASALRRKEEHWLQPELQAGFLWDAGILCPDGLSWVHGEPSVDVCHLPFLVFAVTVA